MLLHVGSPCHYFQLYRLFLGLAFLIVRLDCVAADMGSHHSGSSAGLKVATSAPPMETPQLVSPPNQDSSLQAAPTAPPGELGAHKHHVSLLLINLT